MNVPYEITLLSNAEEAEKELVGFDSPMKLHYSQTDYAIKALRIEFDSPMKLHYSQTGSLR